MGRDRIDRERCHVDDTIASADATSLRCRRTRRASAADAPDVWFDHRIDDETVVGVGV